MTLKLRILLITIGYPSTSRGGTEIYVQALARELQLQGHHVTLVIPSEDETSCQDELLEVCEMPLSSFADFIAATSFDVVHAHPLTASQFLDYLVLCRQQEIPVVVTYHTPTVSCGRGDLLLNGLEPCDGELQQRRCTACIFQQKGLPWPIGCMLAALQGIGVLEKVVPGGKLRSMLSIYRQVRQNLKAFQQLSDLVCHWVAVSQWVSKVLQINRISAEDITIQRQVYCHLQENPKNVSVPDPDIGGNGNGLRVGFIGRIHPYKGLHILLKALHSLPSAKMGIYIVGDTGKATKKYLRLLKKDLHDDPRIHWLGALEPAGIPLFLKKIDVLVVPSIWMETGPMTVLEAWAANIPVIGSDRGGIKEWIESYGGGWLFPPGDHQALAELLDGLADGRIAFLPVPKMDERASIQGLARTMVRIYQEADGSVKLFDVK